MLEFRGMKRELNSTGLNQVFTFWTTQTPNTAFKGVYEIPPGNFAKVKNGIVSIIPYWNLSFSNQQNISLSDATDKFRALFKDSLSLRMRADVPVAAYLSGGIDSTSTTAFIKKMYPEVLNT